VVATQSLARGLDIGLFVRDMAELGEQLRDEQRLDALRASMWRQRDTFSFDYHAPALVAFLREVIATRRPIDRHRGPAIALKPLHVPAVSAGAGIHLPFPAPSAPESQ
jgi:hypothetical protein